MHTPAEQAWPEAQSPQLPPQPSSPQSAPWQLGVQLLAAHMAQSGPLSAWSHRPAPSSQRSTVQATPSSQGGGPATHLPLTRRSSPLQKTPSEQVTSTGAVMGAPKATPPSLACQDTV